MTLVQGPQQPISRGYCEAYTSLPFRHPHSVVSSRLERRKFNLLVRLPDDNLTRIKNLKDGASIKQVKKVLELTSGFPSPTYQLHDVEGYLIDNGAILRLDDNISDNSILKLSPLPPYDEALQAVTSGDNTLKNSPVLSNNKADENTIFNLLYMACYAGNTQDCRNLICSYGISVTMATANGNTPLHAAAVRDHVNTSVLLCEHGADIYQVNKSGSNPLDVALEFGSFTCERHLRLSQWARRRERMTKTECTPTYSPNNIASPSNAHPSSRGYENRETRTLTTQQTEEKAIPAESGNKETEESQIDEAERTTCSETDNRTRSRLKITRARSANVNHKMPPSATAKKKDRLSRAKSAPLLNSEERNQRMCKNKINSYENSSDKPVPRSHDQFKVTRPQYLQYIKSSTGIVEEDYFADIFPEQEEKASIDYRSFDDQMKRNERIFKKMFKESGIAHQDSDTDSDEERVRQFANKKAVRRWVKKKQSQKEEEKQKQRLIPSYPSGKQRDQCLGELLMIGDTSSGVVKTSDPNTYISAYHTHRKGTSSKSARSATSTKSQASVCVDPVTYEEWVDSKPEPTKVSQRKDNSTANRKELTRKIDYETWLNNANSQTRKQLQQRKREEKQKKDFDEWIQELKDEVGTYDYWKRRKEEQLRKERQMQMRQEKEMEKKVQEKEKRKELAKEIYKKWVVDKEWAKLKQEERQLRRERKELDNARQTKNR